MNFFGNKKKSFFFSKLGLSFIKFESAAQLSNALWALAFSVGFSSLKPILNLSSFLENTDLLGKFALFKNGVKEYSDTMTISAQ